MIRAERGDVGERTCDGLAVHTPQHASRSVCISAAFSTRSTASLPTVTAAIRMVTGE